MTGPRSGRISELDGLRFVAATAVFAYHGLIPVPWAREHFGRWLVQLNLGVRAFYVLSGFLISLPFARAALRGSAPPRLGAYVVRRMARVFPAYWLALGVVLVLEDRSFRGVRDAVGQVTLTFLWIPQRGQVFTIVGVAGTVVVEVSFYALVPVLFGALRLLGRVVPSISRLGVHLGAMAVLVGLGAASTWRSAYGSPGLGVSELGTALPALTAGMVLALLSAARAERRRLDAALRRLVRHPGLWWAGALAAFLVLSSRPLRFLSPTPSQVVWQLTWELVVAVLLVTPVVLGGARVGASVVGRVLRCGPVAWIGLVSYGLYLWQGYLIHRIGGARLAERESFGTSRALLLVAAAYVAALAISGLSWYLLERPLQRAAARLIGRAGPRAALSASRR